ncbi:MAG: aromatic-ring-hydroxylating dioxygenase subunit beta [Proteobacteria bacterium]|jgi:3-phenylpropionate/cinnamic acid dioxygenase small subunit|nr:aromatic-ring-hydroxylating dioxygenase subunit beta [Pseudomonadota bacterium]
MSEINVKKALGQGVVIEAIESMTGAESIAPDHMGRGARPATGYVPQGVAVTPAQQQDIEQLLYRQAAMLDAKRWLEWTELFAADGVYWMPAAPEQTDWMSQPSIFAEDRLLMEVRMGRLQHPNAWSQAPQWHTNHLVGNVVVEAIGDAQAEVWSRFQMMELRRDSVRHFGGSYRHSLVRTADGWRIRLQRVDLMNAQAAFDYVIQAWI